MIEKTAKWADVPGDDSAEQGRIEGEMLRNRWLCPRAGFDECANANGLDEECREVLRATAFVTGAGGLTTCPRYYVTLPWVRRASRAYAWREKGEMGQREDLPPAALIEAVEEIASAYGDRLEQEAEKRKREAEEMKNRNRNG